MTRRPLASSSDSTPSQSPDVPSPSDVGNAGQTRLLVEAVKESVSDLKNDLKEIKKEIADAKDNRISDTRWHERIFAAGFVLLAGMLIFGYFRLDDRIEGLSTKLTSVETQLNDLLARIPPIPTAIPGHK